MFCYKPHWFEAYLKSLKFSIEVCIQAIESLSSAAWIGDITDVIDGSV